MGNRPSFWVTIAQLWSEYGPSFLRGAGMTMLIAVISTAIGCVIGFCVGLVQTIPADRKEQPVRYALMRAVRLVLGAYVEVFRGTPMMVQAMFIYYGLAMLWGIYLPMLPAALLVVSVNTGAYMAETVRGGILSIDPGQTEGAKAIGMTHVQTMLYVVLPQALRNIMPQIGNNLIINIKDTCVLSVIGTVELFFTTNGVAGAEYTYFEAFTITMAIYFVLTFTCSRILRFFENRMDGSDTYDLATTDTLAHTSGMYSFHRQRRAAGADQSTREGR